MGEDGPPREQAALMGLKGPRIAPGQYPKVAS